MEEILNKNIFDEKDLQKLSPDYTPSNLLLRMQMRKSMVKDTHSHSHGVLKSYCQRKTIKRVKECYNMNKEIVKIRNNFDNINLKNQIMMKKALKNVDNLNSKDTSRNYDNEEYKTLNDTDPYLEKITEEMSNLVVSNDIDFKIKNKPNVAKVAKPREIRNNRKEKHPMRHLDKNCQDVSEEMLRIECKYYEVPKSDETEEHINTVNEMNFVFAKELDLNQSSSQNNLDDKVNDLQTLLIMMAISPKSNENEHIDSGSHLANCKDIISYNYTTEMHHQRQILVSNTLHQEDITEILNVTPMRIEINERQKQILKKFVKKWQAYVNRRKDYISRQRQATLNSFFDKLTKKKMNANRSLDPTNKAKVQAQDYNTYQHRYKVQKHIIALQKVKLEEQNRMIEELKYNKIVEASQNSVVEMKEAVRKAYFEIDRQLKPKIKCLTNELQIHDIEEPSLVLHCLKVPQFLQRMEKRAREREEKHAMIRERRKQMEEDRIRMKQQAELAKAEMDKEEKIKRIKELREKRKREKIENIRKKQYADRMRALIVMADLHYERSLMTKYGVRPLKLLMEVKQDYIEKATAHYKFQLRKNVFLHWMWLTEDMWFERNYKAEDFNRKKILRRAFDCLKKKHYELILKKQVAEDYYDLYVTQFVFRKFREGIEILRKENEITWKKALLYHNSNLLFKSFTCWRTLPALNALQREQEARKSRWREKVLQVVPDYTPPDD